MMKKIENLGRWAEKYFSTLCSEAGVIANKSEEDETGWDYLLEFPAKTLPYLPPDLQKIERSARAQVKSRERGKRKATLKLSNAHRFAAAPEPCFVILAAATDGGHPVKIYAKHFWHDQIERTLKRLRQAERKTSPTHKQTFDVTFDDADDHTHDLVEWMQKVVEEGGADYATRKRVLNEHIGYEDGRFFGTITFPSTDLEKFVDHSIGLDAKIDLANARLVDRRFGIEAKTPVFDIKPDRVEMRTHPKPCTIEITDSEDQVHRFDGEIFTAGIPGLPLEMAKARVVAGPLEALLTGSGQATFNYHFNSGDDHNLPDLISCVRLLGAIGTGPLQVSAILNGERIDSGRVSTQEVEGARDFRDAATLLTALSKVAERAGEPDMRLSLDSVLHGWDALLEFRNHLDADTMDFSMEGEDEKIAKAEIKRLITGLTLTLEGYRITAVLAYQLKADQAENQSRKLTFLKPTIVRAMVDQRDEAAHGHEVQQEIKRYADRHGEGVITVHRVDSGNGLAVAMVKPTQHRRCR